MLLSEGQGEIIKVLFVSWRDKHEIYKVTFLFKKLLNCLDLKTGEDDRSFGGRGELLSRLGDLDAVLPLSLLGDLDAVLSLLGEREYVLSDREFFPCLKYIYRIHLSIGPNNMCKKT